MTIGGGLVTSLFAAMRVVEGKHFPTYVIAGALVGYAIGVLVPHLHVDAPVALDATLVEGGATVGVSTRF